MSRLGYGTGWIWERHSRQSASLLGIWESVKLDCVLVRPRSESVFQAGMLD